MPFGFDGSGRPVPVEHPSFYDDRNDQDGEPAPGLDAEQLVILAIAGAKTSSDIGERVLVIGYLMKVDGAPTNLRDLAAILGLSHTGARKRVSRFCSVFRRELAEVVSRTPVVDE